MRKDIRDTDLYREMEQLQRELHQAGTGLVSNAAEVSTNGTEAVFAGTQVQELAGALPTRICQIDLATGDTRVLTFGPNVDRLPKFSPDGRQIAFLSDRQKEGDFQLYLIDSATGGVRPAPQVEGWIEYLHWSPDGKQILLGVAGHGADMSGAQGSATSKQADGDMPSWMPKVETGNEAYRWRSAWLYDLATNQARQVNSKEDNIWESVWCGNDALAAMISPGPVEGLWLSAHLHVIDVRTGKTREIHQPQRQMGCLASSPSGKQVTIVEAVCSDRGLVAGDLRLIETESGKSRQIDTHRVDISYAEWRTDQKLLLAGHREFETVIALYDLASDAFTEVFTSDEISAGSPFAKASGLGDSGGCVIVAEGFTRPPEIAVIRQGKYQCIKSFDVGCAGHAQAARSVKRVRWQAPDGLEIQGWLLEPKGKGPYPLVMSVHGGPIWHSQPFWIGRGSALALIQLERGYAVFLPNPRGSTGRGQDFASRVLGDMGGADTHDYLSGLDYLVEQGIADPERLGVIGGSYGGFMTSWLVTQDSRFAAAVSISPVTNFVTLHLLSNEPDFDSLFLADTYTNPNGKYFQRSPIMHARNVKTPTLNICGALDRCTPPEEAMQFHSALLENGVTSELVVYPEEGHGVRKWPAVIDFTARVIAWFDEHMPADKRTTSAE